MHYSDPMGYTMEQLVKALTAETLNEIDIEEINSPSNNYVDKDEDDTWQHIANTIISEIDAMFGEQPLHSYGYHADEVIYTMRSTLQPYSVYPNSYKLLNTIEREAVKRGKEANPYINLVLRMIDNKDTREWKNERTFRQ